LPPRDHPPSHRARLSSAISRLKPANCALPASNSFSVVCSPQKNAFLAVDAEIQAHKRTHKRANCEFRLNVDRAARRLADATQSRAYANKFIICRCTMQLLASGRGPLFLSLTGVNANDNPDALSAASRRETPPRCAPLHRLSAPGQLFVLIIGIIISIFTPDLAGRTRRRRRRRLGGAWEVRLRS